MATRRQLGCTEACCLAKGNVQTLIIGVLVAAVPVTLLFSKSLNAFLLEQRF